MPVISNILNDRNALAARFGDIASEAGRIVMSFYDSGVGIETKVDGSPVSEADRASEALICRRLGELLPGVCVLAEESFHHQAMQNLPSLFLLVDPLDGTREFVSRNGEFTVNIALIRDGAPI